jgi:hypothetical protein
LCPTAIHRDFVTANTINGLGSFGDVTNQFSIMADGNFDGTLAVLFQPGDSGQVLTLQFTSSAFQIPEPPGAAIWLLLGFALAGFSCLRFRRLSLTTHVAT